MPPRRYYFSEEDRKAARRARARARYVPTGRKRGRPKATTEQKKATAKRASTTSNAKKAILTRLMKIDDKFEDYVMRATERHLDDTVVARNIAKVARIRGG